MTRVFALAFAAFLSLGLVSRLAVADDASAEAAPLAPEFWPTFSFDADSAVQLADLKGKMVVMVFFQSCCPICNGWAPDFYEQMTKTYGDDRSVALIAMK